MAERDYLTSPVADQLGLRGIILGLADDLNSLRTKQISPADALARAALAKQIFNGVRLYLNAISTLERAAKQVVSEGAAMIEGDASP